MYICFRRFGRIDVYIFRVKNWFRIYFKSP